MDSCSEDNVGDIVFVADSSLIFYCLDEKWNAMPIRDTLVISTHDTLYINKVDTIVEIDSVFSTQNDTLYVFELDSLYITNIDTLYVSNVDTLYMETLADTGSGILDYHPQSEMIPILENLNHQKRSSGYKLQAQQVVILHFTDIHGDGENLARIKEFRDAYSEYIDEVIHTGDAVYDSWTDSFDFWSEAGADSFLNTLGNHDTYLKYGTQGFVKQNESYNRFFAPFISSWGVNRPENASENSLMYYYKDIDKGAGTEQTKLRLIVLDEYHWNEDQATWLTNVLDDALVNDFAVIICRHEGFDAIPLKNNPFTSLETGIGAANDLLEAQVAVDDFMQKGGEFVVWLGGHGHQDAAGRLPNYPRQIVFLGDLAGMNWTGWNDSWRETGTKSQDCFTLISVDRFEKVVRFVRVGADRDRYGRVKDAMSFNYMTSETIYPAE
ncbi:MAG: metallophosphoesterase [Fibrobacter sp.]|nr:metallophosphoesterase [Fibrobacter sp.]